MRRFNSTVIDSASARLLPWLVGVAFFMQMLDGTILNTALPSIGRSLDVDPLRMQSVVIAYMLTAALLIPASGWLADRFGTRKIFMASLVVFSLGSLLCALSPNLLSLVGARAVQGFGGALMVPVGRLALLRSYPRNELVNLLSFVTMPALIGPLLGPTLGGLFVQYLTWHWIFLINLPVGLIGWLLARRYMPDLRAEERTGFDWQGFLVFSLAMVMATFAAEGFGELQLPRVQASILFIGGATLFAFYWVRAAHDPNPLFSPVLFRTRAFTVGIIGNLFARLGGGALPFVMPLFFQLGLGFSPVKAGLTMMPTALAAIVGKQLVTPLINRVGFRFFLVANTLLLGLLIMSISLISHSTPYWEILAILSLMGVCNAMQFTAMNSVTLVDLPDAEASSGNTLLSVVMQLAQCIGLALGAAVLTALTGGKADLGNAAYMEAFHKTYLWIGGATMITAVIFHQVPKRLGKGDTIGGRQPKPEAAPMADH